jgi:CcmD family protein
MDSRNFMYMFYGFAAAWVILVIYLVLLLSRERKIRKDLENLKGLVEKEPR